MDFLLISASFFGYSKAIKTMLESRGRVVLWYEDRPSLDTKTKALLRVAPSLIRAKCDEYFEKIIEEAKKHSIRDVLVIKGEALSPKMIRKMREALPSARFIIYFWDSYKNMPKDSPQKVDLFDRAYSFDPVDVKRDNRLKLRPLFYLDEYARLREHQEQDIDVLFIGTAHSDRYAVIKKIKMALPDDLNFERFLFMRSYFLYCLYRFFKLDYWFAKRTEFIFKPLAQNEVMALIARAKVVVDIERTIQTGYTMRTLEMLGASRKLITTNSKVKEADFYSENNHLVIDRENPKIPEDFMRKNWVPVDRDILNKYSLSGWLDEIMS